jgi:Zn-dependent peptidase ImmA (M78 family)
MSWDPFEVAANQFAINLLAPECVLRALGVHTPREIADLCNISYQAAKIRAIQMQARRQSVSPLEQELLDQLEPFIAKKLQCSSGCVSAMTCPIR